MARKSMHLAHMSKNRTKSAREEQRANQRQCHSPNCICARAHCRGKLQQQLPSNAKKSHTQAESQSTQREGLQKCRPDESTASCTGTMEPAQGTSPSECSSCTKPVRKASTQAHPGTQRHTHGQGTEAARQMREPKASEAFGPIQPTSPRQRLSNARPSQSATWAANPIR